jgi:hypothetical protein
LNGFGSEVRDALLQRSEFLIKWDWPSGEANALFWHPTFWQRYVGVSWGRLRKTLPSKLAWSIFPWLMASA